MTTLDDSNLAELREQNRALQVQLDRTSKRLDLLISVTRSASLDLDALLRQTLDDFRNVLPAADVLVVYLYDPQQDVLYPRACYGYDEARLSQIRLQPGESMSGCAFRDGVSFLARTPEEVQSLAGPLRPETSSLYEAAIGGRPVLSNICVPLQTPEGEALGTITISSTHASFTQEDRLLVEAVGGHIAQAVNHAQLFEALSKSEERFRQMAQDMPVAISEATHDGELLYWNPVAHKILGYDEQDMRSMTGEQIYVDVEDRRRLVQALMERGEYSYEHRVRRKDGRVIWVRGSSRVTQPTADDGRLHFIGIFEDVTDAHEGQVRRQAIARVREQIWRMGHEQDLQSVLAAVRESLQAMDIPFHDCGINSVDVSTDPPAISFNSMTSDGTWIRSDQEGGAEIVQAFWRAGEVVYRRDLHREDEYGERHTIEQILGSDVRSVIDVPFAQGTLALNSLSPDAFTDRDIEVLREMTDVLSEGLQRQADLSRLSGERERLQVTLASLVDAVITTDHTGCVTLLNRSAEELLGCQQAAAVGRNLQDVYPIIDERTGEPCPSPAQMVIETDRTVGPAPYRVLDGPDGTRRVIEDTTAPIRDPEGGITGTVLVFRDVTAQRRTQQELARTEKLESLGVLAGGIAHDFNNILTAVSGNVSLLKFDAEDDEDRRILDQVERATRRAAALTQQLLTFSKGGEPIKRLADLNELVSDSATFALRGSNVSCELDIPADLWPAEVDTGQLSQVVHNLVLNGGQAMPEGGVVRVSMTNVSDVGTLPLSAGAYVCLTVADQGVGIPARYLEQIFDPYFTTKTQGSGLGLATAHAIVTNHGGHISVTSDPGEGTTFTIYLPALADAVAAGARSDEELISGSGHVLLMDDDESIRSLAGHLLHRLGYTVAYADTGEQAVRACRQAQIDGTPFDCVILDLTVPGGMGGKEALRHILKLNTEIRAIATSGYSTDPVMANPQEFGFCGMVRKPYTAIELGSELRRVLTQATSA